MWFHEADGWRDESSEGPYTAVLKTFYDWTNDQDFSIVRLHNQTKHTLIQKCLKSRKETVIGEFKTVIEAKEKAKLLISEGI